MIRDELDPGTLAVLDAFGFDESLFEELRGRVASGELSRASNVVAGTVEPPAEGDLERLPAEDEDGHEEAREAGLEALAAGRVAALVLAGGMATRFGGAVKGIVEAVDGRSFLDVKLRQLDAVGRAAGTPVPTALMTSFATDAATRAHVARLDVPAPLWFAQFVSLRLSRDGSLFRDAAGAVSPYGPGHGDLADALRSSGTLDALRGRGVAHVVVSNVDNLAARLDPVVVGAHLLAGRPVTVEVAAKEGDMGGAPARVDGRVRLVEGPCFPESFDTRTIPVFNTNTATIELEALAERRDLTWLYVEREVEGRAAVQLERLYHELTAFVPTTFLLVPRHGPRGRFLPIKTPADLASAREELRELVEAPPLG